MQRWKLKKLPKGGASRSKSRSSCKGCSRKKITDNLKIKINDMSVYDLMFYLFAALTLVSAFFVVTLRNIVYSAFFLLFTFFGVVGLYVLLAADFIAIVQLVVYVGGILILLLFGVMLTNKITNVQIKTGTFQLLPAIVGVGLFVGILVADNDKYQVENFSGRNSNNNCIQYRNFTSPGLCSCF